MATVRASTEQHIEISCLACGSRRFVREWRHRGECASCGYVGWKLESLTASRPPPLASPRSCQTSGPTRLRVLIAHHRTERLALLARVVESLGHQIVAREIVVNKVAAVTARVRPDIALVGVGTDPEHALELISEIVREAFCPVIALIPHYDEDWIGEAARRGIYAYIVSARPVEIQSAIDIARSRFIEYGRLQGAFAQCYLAKQQQAQLLRARQRLLLDVQDGILQQLTTASLGLQLDQLDAPLAAVGKAIEQAKSIVSATIEELLDTGGSLDDILRDSALQRKR